MDFEKICMMFAMQEPYYGIILSSMDRIPDKRIDTMGVGRSGNVFRLYYNPDFVSKLSIDAALQALKHETLHLAFNHFTIWDGEDKHDTPEMHKVRNIAADLEVNCYIDTSKFSDEIKGCYVEDFGWEKYQGTREYFARLLAMNRQQQEKEQQANAQAPQQPCNGGQGGQSKAQSQTKSSSNPPSPGVTTSPQSQAEEENEVQQSSTFAPQTSEFSETFLDSLSSFDNHDNWPDEEDDPAMRQQIQDAIDDMLVFAEEEVKKAHGSVPSEMVGRLENIKNKKPKPVADWKRYFRRYLGNEFSEFIRKSKKRESRRFPDAAGNRHRRKSHILVAIDTSGSVSMPEYREFFGQIKTLTATADFHVVECDAAIQYEYDYKGRPNEVLHGHGGTDFQPVIDLYNKDKRKYDALVYFTDGYCDIPADTPKDTLWVISSEGDQSDRKRYKVNGASVAFIPKHKD